MINIMMEIIKNRVVIGLNKDDYNSVNMLNTKCFNTNAHNLINKKDELIIVILKKNQEMISIIKQWF